MTITIPTWLLWAAGVVGGVTALFFAAIGVAFWWWVLRYR